MRPRAFLLAGSCALIVFAFVAAVLVVYVYKAPINKSTRFASIDWLDGQLTNADRYFPNSTIVKDFHHGMITGALTVHWILEFGWCKVLYWFICIGLLVISLLLIAIYIATKSHDHHFAKYLWIMWADSRDASSVSNLFDYISFTPSGSEDQLLLPTRSVCMENSAKISANFENFLFPENAV